MPIYVVSTAFQFETPSKARAAVDGPFELVRQEGAAVEPHGRLDAMVTPLDEDHLVTAVAAEADEDRVTAVQIAAVERIEPDALDATATQLARG